MGQKGPCRAPMVCLPILVRGLSIKQGSLADSPFGYSTEARQQKEQKYWVTQGEGTWLRKTPCIFTGCLAHADITVERVTKEVKRIVGWFEHIEGCKLAQEIAEGAGGEVTKEELDEFWQRIAPEGPRGIGR
jgi:hypothetical protein